MPARAPVEPKGPPLPPPLSPLLSPELPDFEPSGDGPAPVTGPPAEGSSEVLLSSFSGSLEGVGLEFDSALPLESGTGVELDCAPVDCDGELSSAFDASGEPD